MSLKKPWCRALFLDFLLTELHLRLTASRSASFSLLFLNAGAHIQHHHMLRSEFLCREGSDKRLGVQSHTTDPLYDMFMVYDRLVKGLFNQPKANLLFATGLGQVPYDRTKYYWRLKNHSKFLCEIGIKFDRVLPRMTRDFLIEFDDKRQLSACIKLLASIVGPNKKDKLFGVLEPKKNTLFVTLSYPDDLPQGSLLTVNEKVMDFSEHVAFVAQKNGMHDSKGFIFATQGISRFLPVNGSHVRHLKSTIVNYLSN